MVVSHNRTLGAHILGTLLRAMVATTEVARRTLSNVLLLQATRLRFLLEQRVERRDCV